ncbi:MAG: TonB-dependent receptor [Pseudomonadota bacterium]|nr:TonB-dependent receptor [Pseudomonadota bacterium]
MPKFSFLVAACLGLSALHAFADDGQILEEVTIIGDRDGVRTLLGSGALVDSEQVANEVLVDINQALKTVPGIYIQEEDGYGLRPNIGIRGATSERSSKISLLEDGVMIAPAPYSNPSAYYFPTAARMHALEVIKGAPLLRYGPHTTGGVLNMVSTPIPDSVRGRLRSFAGQNGEVDVLANYGGTSGNWGYLVETTQRRSDGFKDIDRGGDTGYEVSDYMAKVSWAANGHRLFVKAQYSEETSDETYLGLTDADFASRTNRRYGLSAPDQMNNEHEGYMASYSTDLADNVALSLTAYLNKFSRDWFKLSGGGKLVNAANAGDATALGVLHGTIDKTGLKYKHNNRSYESSGVEVNFDIDLNNHQLALGMRAHGDEMDRFQPQDLYDQVDGSLSYVSTIAPTGSNNRLEEADATSFWATDDWQMSDRLNVNLMLRFEDVETSRRQFADTARATAPSTRSNNTSLWLPGASLGYQLNDNVLVIASVHKGFSPLGGGAKSYEKPETSYNYEVGLRYSGVWFAEAIGFYSDFSNKAENCSNAAPCSNGATSGSFVTGEAVVQGLELQVGSVVDLSAGVTMPFDLAYTLSNAEISKTNDNFNSGDRLASVPEQALSLRAGIIFDSGWENYAAVKYIDEMCIAVGCTGTAADFDKTESLLRVDLVSHYQLSDRLKLFAKLENLADEQVIIARTPDGARPNKGRTASVGFELNF